MVVGGAETVSEEKEPDPLFKEIVLGVVPVGLENVAPSSILKPVHLLEDERD